MSRQELLNRLLETWRNRWLANDETRHETLCHETPELLAELKQNIQQIKLLDDLIGKFEEQRQAGQHPSPEEICREHPGILARFKEEIQKLAIFDSVFGETVAVGEPGPESVTPFCDGRYNIQSVLNRGGQGIIYKAHDRELGRSVVVKGPGRRGLGRVALGRLEQEAHTTGRLEHPGVVPVYGFGRDQGGKPYYAMKYIDGETLSIAILRFHGVAATHQSNRKTVEFQKLLRDFVLVCQTIAYAHSRGVVHRDIKPANIMLGKFGEVWVVDWGLAKHVAAESEVYAAADHAARPAGISWRSQWLSQTHSIQGTLMYMSPEQAEGRNKDVGPVSDVYSLGATLYELLAGRAPVLGRTPAEIMEKVIVGNIAPCRESKADVPPALEAICLKALSRRPQDRYASAGELADDLERWLADEPVTARPEPPAERAFRWVRQHQTIVVGAVAALLGIAVGLGLLAAKQSWLRATIANHYRLLTEKNAEIESLYQSEQAAADLARINEQKAKGQEALAKERLQAEQKAKEATKKVLYYSQIALARSEWLAGNMRRTRQLLESCEPELRGWEWRYLHRLCNAELRKFEADGAVACLSRSSDGRVIAVGRTDGSLAAWDKSPQSGEYWRMVGSFSFPSGGDIKSSNLEVAAVAVSPDGTLVAAASDRKGGRFEAGPLPNVRVWDVASGKLAFELSIEADAVTFSPDGKTLAVATNGGVELWNVATQKRARSFRLKKGVRCGLTYSASGRYLATSGWLDGIVKVWDLNAPSDQAEELSLEASGMVHCVALSADGQRLAAGTASGVIDLWNLKALRAKDTAARTHVTLAGHREPVRSLDFHPQLAYLASGGNDRLIKIWSVEIGREQHTLRGHEESVTGVAFASGGQELVSASLDGTVKFWNPLERQEAEGARGVSRLASIDRSGLATTVRNVTIAGAVSSAMLQPRSRWATIAAGLMLYIDTVRLSELAIGENLEHREGQKGTIGCVALSRDGKLAASGDHWTGGGESIVWNVSTGETVARLHSKAGDFKFVAFSPDGETVATASERSLFYKASGMVTFWNLKTSQPFLTAGPVTGEPSSLTYSPHGNLLAVTTRSGPLWVFDAKSGRQLWVFKDNSITRATFSPDGKFIAATGGNKTNGGHVWVFRADTGKLDYELVGHSDTIRSVTFNPSGDRIFTAGADGFVRVWDPELRQEVFSLPHADLLNQLEPGALERAVLR